MRMSLLFVLTFVTQSLWAQTNTHMTYTGRLYDASGAPVPSSSVYIRTEVMRDATCYLFRRDDTSTTDADGNFSVDIKAGLTGQAFIGGADLRVLLSTTHTSSLTCYDAAGVPGGTFVPSGYPVQSREIVMSISTNSGSSWEVIDSQILNPYYQAQDSERLGGKVPSAYLTSGTVSQSTLDSFFTGTNFASLQNYSSGGALSSSLTPSAGTDVVNKTYSDSYIGGRATAGFGTLGAGQNGYVLSWDGSQWVASAASATDNTKLPLAGGTLTGDLAGTNASFSGSLGVSQIYNTRYLTMASAGYLLLSNNATDPPLTSAYEGALWYNSSSDKVMLRTTAGTLGLLTDSDFNMSNVTRGTLSVSHGGTGLGTPLTPYALLTANMTGTAFEQRTCASGEALVWNAGTGWMCQAAGTGSVTNVTLDASSIFNVVNNSVSTAGTMSLSLAPQAQNLVLAAPTGGTGTPSFRYLENSDIPGLDASKLVSGLVPTSRGGTGINASAAASGTLLIGNGTGFSLNTLSAGTGISIVNSAGGISISSSLAGGSVTNVGLTAPTSVFSVTGSPVTGAGTMSMSFASQGAATVFAAPAGTAGVPSFRSLAATDLPILAGTGVTLSTSAGSLVVSATASTGVVTQQFEESVGGNLVAVGKSVLVNGASGNEPGASFHVKGNSIFHGIVQLRGTTGTDRGYIYADDAGGGADFMQFRLGQGAGEWRYDTGAQYVATLRALGHKNAFAILNRTAGSFNDTPAVILSSDGNDSYVSGRFGVGTTVPLGLLQVENALDMTSSANLLVTQPNLSAGQSNSIHIGTDDVVGARVSYVRGGVPYLNFGINDGNPSAMAIMQTGNVGIGTTAPNALLDVSGNMYIGPASGGMWIDATDSGSSTNANFMVRRFNGDWTFQTSQPRIAAQILHAGHDNNFVLYDKDTSTTAGSIGVLLSSNGSSYLVGSLGIGTRTPGSALDVVGSIRADQVCDRAGTNCKVISSGWTGAGTVTSVGLTAPTSVFTTGSAVTGSGNLSLSFNSQSAAQVLASPTGAAGVPSFRPLVGSDIPGIDASKIVSGSLSPAFGGSPWIDGTNGLYYSAKKVGIGAEPTVGSGVLTLTALTGDAFLDVTSTAASTNAGIALTARNASTANPTTSIIQDTGGNLRIATGGTTSMALTPAGKLTARQGSLEDISNVRLDILSTGTSGTAGINMSSKFGGTSYTSNIYTDTNGALVNRLYTDVRTVLNPAGEFELVNPNSSTAEFPAFMVRNYAGSSGGYPGFMSLAARGIETAPTATQSGDVIGAMSFNGYGSGHAEGASILAQAAANWTGASRPAKLHFSTSNTSGSSTIRMTILPDGAVGIGTLVPSYLLQVNGTAGVNSLCIAGDCRSAWPAAGGSGTVTSVEAGAGLTGGTITGVGTIALSTTGVVAGVVGNGSYIPQITNDVYGRITNVGSVAVAIPTTAISLAAPTSVFTVSGSPAAYNGNLGLTLNSQTAATVFAAPTGAAGVPSFRALAATDLPALDTSKITSGILPVARGGSGVGTTPGNGQLLIGNGSGYSLSTLTAGTGISITNSAGGITVASSGGASQWTTDSAGISFASGSVAIGTTTHRENLDVTGTGDIGIGIGPSLASSANALLYLRGRNAGVENQVTLKADYDGNFQVLTSNNRSLRFGDSNNEDRFYLDNNSSRVGIMTTSPAWTLDVNGPIGFGGTLAVGTTKVLRTVGATSIAVGHNAGSGMTSSNSVAFGASTMLAATGGSNVAIGYGAGQAMTSGAGNTLLGTAAGSALTIGANNTLLGNSAGTSLTTGSNNILIGSSINTAAGTNGSLNIGGLVQGNLNSGAMSIGLFTEGTARLFVNSAGNVGIGTTSPANPLDVTGAGRFTGVVTALSFTSTSDERFKKDIETMPGLEAVHKLRGVSYKWRANDEGDAGVIAQEVERVFPDAVRTDAKGFKSVKYNYLLAPLIEAVKELDVRCESRSNELEARIHELEDQNAKLLDRQKQLEERLLRLERAAGLAE